MSSFSRRRERAVALVLAALLVLFRSLPFALFEQIQFDSDQAIFGLMAKHVSEGRALPLFMYGQPYLLAVDSWLAAPWFIVAPPGLATLSVSIVLVNVLTGLAIVVALERWGGLRPLAAVVVSLPFLLVPPPVSGDLVSTSGANVYPFMYVVLLWMLRDRPFWFGSLLAVGFLQREFTVYGAVIIIGAELLDRPRFSRPVARKWLLALVAFLAVREGILALQPHADLLGPGTRGQLYGGFEGSQIGNLTARVDVRSSDLAPRLDAMLRVHLARLMGVTSPDELKRPRPVVAWIVVLLFAAALYRIIAIVWCVVRARAWPDLRRAAIGWYLLGVGCLAALVYAGARPVRLEYTRYGLLVLFIPVGLLAVTLALDRSRWARRAVAAGAVLWAVVPVVDAWRLYRHYSVAAPAELRILADALDARGVRSGWAPYWTAYAVTFLTDERVIIASTDLARIDQYQSFALSRGDSVRISEQPCGPGEKIARWYVCPPKQP